MSTNQPTVQWIVVARPAPRKVLYYGPFLTEADAMNFSAWSPVPATIHEILSPRVTLLGHRPTEAE